MRQRTRGTVVAVALACTTALLVWNGIFDLHVSLGEKQYLIEAARARLGEGATPSMSAIMADAVHDGARRAAWWAVVVLGLTLAASRAAARQLR